ncbi:MAG: Rieske 2Fe-2S domain-containing protein [Alphaproteobacteria bacterium]|nr:Rieske 2Fe-2S domain-containing protein [Alphaproteobacteria bacterium]
MGIRDLFKRRAEHGGLRSYAKQKMKAALGGQDAPPSSPERASSSKERQLPTAPDAEGRVAVAWSADLAEGEARTVLAGDAAVAVFRVDGQLFAIDSACTHEDGPLGEGTLEGGVVTCPYHDWRFEVRTGRCLSHEDRDVACYQVVEQDGVIRVGARTSSGTGERGGAHDDGLEVIVKQV